MAAPTPPPGPSTTALRRASARNSPSSAGAVDRPHHDREVRRRIDGKRLARAAIVTSPAPPASAPRAASRAAPVVRQSARHHDGMAARIFVPVEARRPESTSPQSAGALANVCGLIALQHARRNADVGDAHRSRSAAAPAAARGRACGGRTSPLSRGLDRSAHHRAGRAVDAARQIDRDDRHAARIHRLDHRARRALDRRGRGRRRTAHRR